MDTAALEAFVAVAEEGSFTAASDRLHLTQPAVSKRIALLESELGSTLFDRTGRRTRLTEAGRALVPGARNILRAIDDTRRTVENLSGQISGRLSLATSHHIGLHHLPGVLREYASRYPEVRLDPHFLDSEAACRSVRKGDSELAIVTLPPTPLPPLEERLVWNDPLELVIAAHDAPPSLEVRDIPETLRNLRAVLPAETTFTRSVISAGLEEIGFSPGEVLETNNLETIKMLVAIGFGWSVLPRTMIDESLRVIDTGEVRMLRRLGVIVHANRTLGNAAGAMLNLLDANPR
ncbi:MAG: LysR family transcriptional regulator [Pseudomonadota bacterium]|nr:LysR family transcriptional regulator [Pseudomonadota bacterium]